MKTKQTRAKAKPKITGRIDVDIFTVFRQSMVATIDEVDDTEDGVKALVYLTRTFFADLEKLMGIKPVLPSDVNLLAKINAMINREKRRKEAEIEQGQRIMKPELSKSLCL